MKILVAGYETARLLTNLRDGFKALGHEAASCLLSLKSQYYLDIAYDHIPDLREFVSQPSGVTDQSGECEPTDAFHRFVEPFDLFVFVSMATLLPGMRDLPLLHKMGKKTIVFSTGSDMRFMYPSSLMWNGLGYDFPLSRQDIDQMVTLSGAFVQPGDYERTSLVYKTSLAPKLYLTSMASLYADAVMAGPCNASLMTAPYFVGVNTVNSAGIETKIHGRKKPVILHAPTSETYKGTTFIMAALERLRADGVDFELVTLGKIPNADLKKLLTLADIVVDDIWCGGHGILANEAMLSGCVVLGANEPRSHPLPRNRPVIPLTKEHLYARLKRAILDLPFRKRVAEFGVAYMRSGIHLPEAVAAQTLACLDRATVRDYDYYSTLFLDNPFWPGYKGYVEQTGAALSFIGPEPGFTHAPENVPECVRNLAARVLVKRGAHPASDVGRFLAVLLGENKGTRAGAVPRWNMDGATQVNPWLWTGKNVVYGFPDEGAIPWTELAATE